MNKLQQLKATIEKAQKELDDYIEQQKKQVANIRWRAEENEGYFYVNSWGEVMDTLEDECNMDNYLYSIGNYFKTKKEAVKYREHLLITQQLKDIALRLNNGVKIDWNDEGQYKYYLYFRHCENDTGQGPQFSLQVQGVIYCLSPDFIKVAIEEIGEDKLKEYLRNS